jgi:hypothetical protein
MTPRISTSPLRYHEGKACDAVLRVLEQRRGAQRAGLWSPEKTGDPDPVELVCDIGATRFAIEHTGIEPFSGHIHMTAQAGTHLQPIIDRVSGNLPTADRYELHIPVAGLQPLKGRHLATVQDALADFVIQKAPSLPLGTPFRYVTPITKHAVPGVPFPVSVHRLPTLGIQERFAIIQLVDGSLETRREARLVETCRKKFPKLARWRAKAGARSVLVLEDNDMILTNHEKVWQALQAAEASHAERPDDVYVVSTFLDDLWWVVPLRHEGRSYYGLTQDERAAEFDPQTLIDIFAEPADTP